MLKRSHVKTMRECCDMYYTTTKDVCHKLYSNYYRSTINILRRGNAKKIFTGHLCG